MNLFWLVFVSASFNGFSAVELTPSSGSKFVELRAPITHYLFSRDLSLSYKILTDNFNEFYTAHLVNSEFSTSIHNQTVILSSSSPFGVIEIPCSLLAWPGDYSVVLYSQKENSPQPEIRSNIIKILWLEAVLWQVPTHEHLIFTESLSINVSLISQISCPQQEPEGIAFHLDLIYVDERNSKADHLASPKLSWPLVRMPRNFSMLYPCHLTDRIGAYYATLSLIAPGHKIILDQSPRVRASRRASDFSLMISGDVKQCINKVLVDGSGGGSGVPVSYHAPACIGADTIRLYRLEGVVRNVPMTISEIKQIYVMEKPVKSRPRYATFDFPCKSMLNNRRSNESVLGYCWIYTSISRSGVVTELPESRQCFPATDSVEKVWQMGQRATWSDWGKWTPCTLTCQKGHGDAVSMRSRICGVITSLYDQLCFGPSVQIIPCQLPTCNQTDESIKSFRPYLFHWNPLETSSHHNRTYLISGYSSFEAATAYENQGIPGDIPMEDENLKFRLIVLVTFGGILLLMLLLNLGPSVFAACCKTTSATQQKRLKTGKAFQRDSKFTLISKEDEPATSFGRSVNIQELDQPSRSGVIELRTLSESGKSQIYCKPMSANRSPLIMKKLQDDKKRNESDNISEISSRPETNDALDFEYDDDMPAMLDEEETWPAKKLDIQVFATAYEDILKDLNSFHRVDNSEAPLDINTHVQYVPN